MCIRDRVGAARGRCEVGRDLLQQRRPIGRQALEVIHSQPEHFFVAGLAAGRSIDILREQIYKYRPRVVSVADRQDALMLSGEFGSGTTVCWGEQGLNAVATCRDARTVLTSVTGTAGLVPTVAAIKAGKDIALANKETLVAAGSLVMAAAKAHGVSIIPVDSEHSAIFQALHGQRPEDVRLLWLTASGGPFRAWDAERLGQVTAAQALKHPNWSMGPKITIDSATMMNKALEVIEASVLCDLPVDKVRVYIHPQSIIHSMVEFVDGSVIAQLGVPDMRLPIAYALTYPRRLPLNSPPLDLCQIGQLTFEAPDTTRFPGLALGYAAAKTGGTMPAVLNAANEMAVAAFLKGRLTFMGIPETVEATMTAHQSQPLESLEQILAVNRWARDFAHDLINRGG